MKSVTGKVLRGRKLARKLGFPTANILCVLDLPEEVYVATTIISTESKKEWPSLAYIKDGILEVYLIDADVDLYDMRLLLS